MAVAGRFVRLMLFALLPAACQQTAQQAVAPPVERGPPALVLPAGFAELGRCGDPDGDRLVVAHRVGGRSVALLYADGPELKAPPEPVDGAFVDCRRAEIARDDGAILRRWLVMTRIGEVDTPRLVVTVFRQQGKTPSSARLARRTRIMKRGTYRGTRISLDRAEAAVLYGREPYDRGVLIDLAGERELRDSELSVRPDDLLDLAFVDGWRIEIVRGIGNSGSRLRALGPRNEGFEFELPGEYVSAVQGGGISAIASRRAGAVRYDLIRIPDGPLARDGAPPQRGLVGEHRHLQYDEVADQGRVAGTVYDRAHNQTTTRVFSDSGGVVATVVLPGEFRRAVRIRVATTVNRRPALLTRAVLATSTGDGVDGTVIDLLTGQKLTQRHMAGRFVSLSANPAGAATLTTSTGSVRIPGD